MPDLQVNSTCTKKNYDDNPLIDGNHNKIYLSVSYGGCGYMFIWFGHIHWHTYGFHLIDGGEGQKDPFSSLFKFKEEMPKHISYDFACGLSEICKQVNSYLQCIKYTGAHLSQEEYFMFFTQFFLYLLNQKKTKKFRENANVALAFQL